MTPKQIASVVTSLLMATTADRKTLTEAIRQGLKPRRFVVCMHKWLDVEPHKIDSFGWCCRCGSLRDHRQKLLAGEVVWPSYVTGVDREVL